MQHPHNLKILWNCYQSTQQWLIKYQGGGGTGLGVMSYLDYTQLL